MRVSVKNSVPLKVAAKDNYLDYLLNITLTDNSKVIERKGYYC